MAPKPPTLGAPRGTRGVPRTPWFLLRRLTPPQVALLRALVRVAPRDAEPVLVGGAVRDALLGRRAAVDLDVAVARGALAIARRLADALGSAFVPLAAQRGAASGAAPG